MFTLHFSLNSVHLKLGIFIISNLFSASACRTNLFFNTRLIGKEMFQVIIYWNPLCCDCKWTKFSAWQILELINAPNSRSWNFDIRWSLDLFVWWSDLRWALIEFNWAKSESIDLESFGCFTHHNLFKLDQKVIQA